MVVEEGGSLGQIGMEKTGRQPYSIENQEETIALKQYFVPAIALFYAWTVPLVSHF